MKKVVYKIWYDYEKEEVWLNEMAAAGWAMTGMFHCRYVFEQTEPRLYNYRIQLLPKCFYHAESEAYIEFVEGTGTKCIGRWLKWAYFRRLNSEGPLELFTDRASQQQHFMRVYRFWIGFAWLEGIIGAFNVLVGLATDHDESMSLTNVFLGLMLLFLAYFFWRLASPLKRKAEKLQRDMLLEE